MGCKKVFIWVKAVAGRAIVPQSLADLHYRIS